MKTSFVIFLGVLCLSSDPVKARILQQGKNKNKDEWKENDWNAAAAEPEKEKNKNKDWKNDWAAADTTEDAPDEKEESKEFGYASAQSLWSSTDKGYSCANILQTFWKDVKKNVFTQCESQWAAAQQSNVVGSCRRGAKKFAMEQVDSCFNVEDCYRLGIGASSSVSRVFCNNSEGLMESGEAIPRKCKGLAVTTCASDAVKAIDGYFQNNACEAVQKSTLDYVDKIYELCETEVDDKEANLEV